MFAEAGFSEQPDFVLPLFGMGLLFVATAVAVYLAFQLVMEMLSGGCDVTVSNLLRLTTYVAVVLTLLCVYMRLAS